METVLYSSLRGSSDEIKIQQMLLAALLLSPCHWGR